MAINFLKNKKYSPGFKQFLVKTAVFLVLFIVISFILGKKAYNSNLIYGFDLYIYGGMGYILLFSVLGFILLYREKLFKLEKSKRITWDNIFLVLSIALLALFYFVELNIDKIQISATNILMVHALLLGALTFLLIGIYNTSFLSNFIKKFKKELTYFLIFGIITYSLMAQVWKLWPYLSQTVSNVVYFMLNQISDNVKFVPPDTIYFEDFGAKIAEACSGVYSIFIFTGLYLFILFVDWKKLNKARAISIFIPAVIGAFIVNILRVFLLMVVGAYISREAALGLYHSYTGMVFFMIYFIVFWAFAYKWIKKK